MQFLAASIAMVVRARLKKYSEECRKSDGPALIYDSDGTVLESLNNIMQTKLPSRLITSEKLLGSAESYLKLSELAYQILSRKEKWITMMRLMNTMTMNCSPNHGRKALP